MVVHSRRSAASAVTICQPAEVPGREQGLETERGWWMGAKSSGQSLQLRVLRKVHWERDIVQAGGGMALCKGQRQESRRPPPPHPRRGGKGEAGRREARVTGQGLWGLQGVPGLDPAH